MIKHYHTQGQTVLLVMLFLILLLAGFWLGYTLLPEHSIEIFYGGGERLLSAVLPFYQQQEQAEGAPLPGVLAAAFPYYEQAGEQLRQQQTPVEADHQGGLIVVEPDPVTEPPPPAGDDTPVTMLSDQPLVGIYSTHATESYLDYKRPTDRGGQILEVAAALKEALQARGMISVFSDKVHDIPDWSASYSNSAQTAQALLDEHPSIQILIDVHRDSSIAGVNTTLKREGGDVARIMFVVGSNARLKHPNWQENKQFAEAINSQLETMAPGISRGVRVSNSRYNQQLTPKAILVEMGSTDNTLEQAKASAELLAEAIYQVMLVELGSK